MFLVRLVFIILSILVYSSISLAYDIECKNFNMHYGENIAEIKKKYPGSFAKLNINTTNKKLTDYELRIEGERSANYNISLPVYFVENPDAFEIDWNEDWTFKFYFNANKLAFFPTNDSYHLAADCEIHDRFFKKYNISFNKNYGNQNNTVSTQAKKLDKDSIRDQLKYYKELYDEELISLEDYNKMKEKILSGNIEVINNNNNQNIKNELEIEKQKLEEMKRQTELAQKNLDEQKRIADEAASANRRKRFNDSIKTMQKGLCLAYGC